MTEIPAYLIEHHEGDEKEIDNYVLAEDFLAQINGPTDSHLRLTPEHYELIVRFAVELCRE